MRMREHNTDYTDNAHVKPLALACHFYGPRAEFMVGKRVLVSLKKHFSPETNEKGSQAYANTGETARHFPKKNSQTP